MRKNLVSIFFRRVFFCLQTKYFPSPIPKKIFVPFRCFFIYQIFFEALKRSLGPVNISHRKEWSPIPPPKITRSRVSASCCEPCKRLIVPHRGTRGSKTWCPPFTPGTLAVALEKNITLFASGGENKHFYAEIETNKSTAETTAHWLKVIGVKRIYHTCAQEKKSPIFQQNRREWCVPKLRKFHCPTKKNRI